MDLKRWISKNIPQSILFVLQPAYRQLQRIKYALSEIADSLKIIGPEQIYGENYYSKRREDPWRSDAQNVSTTLANYFQPDSVIDFGCAIGAYLEPLHDNGIDIKGIEGNPDAFEYAVVPREYLEEYDLRNQYSPKRSYDLALCFELAEHLPEKHADNLVDSLVSSSNIIVMTAATPGQGGTHHVNEQPREYWCEKFQSRGYEYRPEIVKELRNLIEVEQSTWVPENLMVFSLATDEPT